MQDLTRRATQLEVAFDAFNQVSMQLEASYRDLENRVSALNEELAEARHERLLQLAEKERLADRLERLIELMPAGVLVLDAEQRIDRSNPLAEEILGMPLLGVSWKAVVETCFLHEGAEPGQVALHNGRQVSVSRRSLDAEPGAIVLIVDVTEQHGLQEMVKRQDRLATMGEMAAQLAHQIRTPLASALLYASHLQKEHIHPHDRHRFGDRLIKRLKHLEKMINDMLLFAKGGATGLEEVVCRELFGALEQLMEAELKTVQGSLRVEQPDADWRVVGNRDALLGALSNLVQNAIQNTGEGVCIDLRAQRRQDRLVIRVQDNGPGIETELRERIFTPFFTTRTDGTGLGLAIVRAVLQAHHGHIEVCAGETTGACFEITLPLVASRPLASGEDRGHVRCV